MSLIELIANPGRYNGKRVQTAGYVLGRNDGAIYLSELDAHNGLVENSLTIPLLDSSLTRRFGKHPGYGVVVGTFDRDQRGPGGPRAGALVLR